MVYELGLIKSCATVEHRQPEQEQKEIQRKRAGLFFCPFSIAKRPEATMVIVGIHLNARVLVRIIY
jgi:hypothetical protein